MGRGRKEGERGQRVTQKQEEKKVGKRRSEKVLRRIKLKGKFEECV